MCSGEQVLAIAKQQIGIPYVFGGASPSDGFDCSGLVVYSYRQACGMGLPHSTSSLINYGSAVSKANLRAGDLVFPSAGHVGIAIDSNQMVVAPHTGENVKIQNIYAFYAGRRII